MPKYHTNPETGNPSACRATKKCPFGDLNEDHYASKEEARAAYEAERASFTSPAPTAVAMLEPFKKAIEKVLPTLDSVRHTDGSVFGSSVQSRLKEHWGHAQYVAQSYVDKKGSWPERRGFYGQIGDSIMRMRDELGERSWGGVKPEYKLLNERLGQLQANLRELTGPDGAKKERELGLHPEAAKSKPEPHRHVWTTVGARYNYEDLECSCGATRRVYDE